MARGLQGVMLRSFGARDHTATVIETISIAPHFVRVRMVSPTLFQDAEAEPAAWLRFWFPDPNGSNTEFQRAYTISKLTPPRAASRSTLYCMTRRVRPRRGRAPSNLAQP